MASFQLNWADDRARRRSSSAGATWLLALVVGGLVAVCLAPRFDRQGVQSTAEVTGLRGRL